MRALKCVVAAAMLAAPLLLAITPAEAYTARQTALQGRGIYTTSKGVPQGWGYRRYRGYRPGWRHRGWRRPYYRRYGY